MERNKQRDRGGEINDRKEPLPSNLAGVAGYP